MHKLNNYPLYEHQIIHTLRELLDFSVSKYQDKPAIIYPKNKKEDTAVSYKKLKQDIFALGTYLFSKGYKNCKIGVFGENSYEWVITHFAVTCGKNVIVPIDKDLDSKSIEYLLTDSECSLLIYSDLYADIVDELRKSLRIDYINMKNITEIVNKGKTLINGEYFDYVNQEVLPSDLASIVYTSGTTGKPKGVMLTHNNLAIDTCAAANNVLLTGSTILVLPLHHVFGLVASLLAEIFYGTSVYINKSLKNLTSDFKKVKPQHLFAVPLIVETLYKSIWNTARKQKKDKILRLLVKLSDALIKLKIDLRKQFFKSVLSAFGGNIDLIVSGGAPIDEKYINAFRSFGITVLNGYGITECAPIVAVNRNQFSVAGSVGIPLCCNQVKIAEDGEILVKGDNVMLGYYHNDDENRNVFTDGWFKTGDIGFLDEYGALHITGRIKNLIILANGENISAESIEQEIYTIPYVKEAVAYGDAGVIVAEIYLNDEMPNSRKLIDSDIKKLNQRLPQIKNICKIIIRDNEFPKTTTKKIIRNNGGK